MLSSTDITNWGNLRKKNLDKKFETTHKLKKYNKVTAKASKEKNGSSDKTTCKQNSSSESKNHEHAKH